MRGIHVMFVLAVPTIVSAQSVGHDLENGFKDLTSVWTSPARLKSNSWAPLVGATAGTIGLVLIDEPFYRWLIDHQGSTPLRLLKPFREEQALASLGHSHVLAAGSMILYAVGWVADSRDLRQAGMGCISAAFAATTSRTVITNLIGRLRPRYEKGAFRFQLFDVGPWERRSFIAGHAAHATSCVSFWNHRFDLGLAEPLLYMTATGIGMARVMDGLHWPSDTFAGQALGLAIGKAVADRYSRRDRSTDAGLPAVTVVLHIAVPF
jgi:hypothetical protein